MFGRMNRGFREYLHHLSIARGSLMETETYLQIAVRLNYLNKDQVKVAWSLLQEAGRLLNGLMRSLSEDGQTGIQESIEEYETPDP